MIICSNCGATNNEANGTICRKCGALLPLSTKHPRIEVKSKEKKQIKSTAVENRKEKKLDLQEIPFSVISKDEESEILDNTEEFTIKEDLDHDHGLFKEQEKNDKEYLKEITPTPFKSPILAEKKKYGSLDQQNLDAIPKKEDKLSDSKIIRQKQLEADMSKVLKFLSNKITVKPLPSKPLDDNIIKEKEEVLPPLSMNAILEDLSKIDLNIEASAIIKPDGTILASAISSRISDSLFGAIGQNLTMIGIDIINGLSAGSLRNISLRGSEGVLDLAPISEANDIILIIFSNPKVKSGIISLAASFVKKQVKEYLGITKN